jgi:alpha-mannosidase
VALELEGMSGPLPIEGPVKACQIDDGKGRLVVEVPALGFAWLPQAGPPGTPPQASRMRLADNRCVRNEFFEAEVDPATGGLKAIRDHRTRMNRLGQQLVYNPGSRLRVKEVRLTANGPALGELVSEGAVLDEQERCASRFTRSGRPTATRGTPTTAPASPGATSGRCSCAASTAPRTSPATPGRRRRTSWRCARAGRTR